MNKFSKPFFTLLFGSLFSFVSGCGGASGPPEAPKEASKVIVQTRDLLIEASFGGAPLQKKADAKQYEGQFPEAAKAIADGSVVIVWGRLLKEAAASPEIVAYESIASTAGGWAVKEDAKLYKVNAAEVPAVPKSGK